MDKRVLRFSISWSSV